MANEVRKSMSAGCLIVLTVFAIIASLCCLFMGGMSALVGATEIAAILITAGVGIFTGAFVLLLLVAG